MTGVLKPQADKAGTPVQRAPERLEPLPRLKPNAFRPADAADVVLSLVGSFVTVWLVFSRFSPFDGTVGFVVIWYVTFVVAYTLIGLESLGRLAALDRLVTAVIAGLTLISIVPLFLVLGFVVVQGIRFIGWNTISEDLSTTPPSSPSTEGGAFHSIVGSFMQVGMATVIVVPLGVTTAIFLNEIGGPLRRPVRILIDAMSGVPSIVAGLFIYTAFILRFNQSFGALPAAFALSILMLPTVTRTALEVLRLVPDGLREASLALGSPEWRTALQVVVPTARSGIITAIVLGMARIVGETAPVLFTAFGNAATTYQPWGVNQDNLPLNVFFQTRSFLDTDNERGYAAALILMTIVLVLFVIARVLSRRRPGHVSIIRRLIRARTRRSGATTP